MLGIIENILCVTLFNNFAQIHKDDVVGNALSLTQGMSNHDNGIVLL